MLHLDGNIVTAQQTWHSRRRLWEAIDTLPPLHIVVYLENLFLVEKLISNGADFNAVSFGWFLDGCERSENSRSQRNSF